METAFRKEIDGPAFTMLLDNVIVGCAGIQIFWPGTAVAWANFAKEAFSHPRYAVWITRMTKGCLRDSVRAFHLRRIEMVVLVGNINNIRWAQKLGFEVEGISRRYTLLDEDVYRMAWVAPK